jgi:hypothetical protein
MKGGALALYFPYTYNKDGNIVRYGAHAQYLLEA